ncbi:hypothetical protein Q6O31_001293 [Salmonella enterica]|nr:hypothetical protein [Salmonella enterica]
MGMTQSRASLGYSAFLGKMEISSNDREKAIELLTKYALEHCDKVAALRKLENDIKPKVMQVLATFAFADYSRSAASTRTCDCCGGKKFIDAEVMTMKSIGKPYLEERKETVKVLCRKCKGKEPIAKMRAMTITGLTLFLDVTLETWRTYRMREDLSEVVTRAEQIIYDQKFSGAAADLLNANIIARDLGLKEQSQVEDVTPDKGDRDKRRSRIKELFNRGTGRDS